jgi:hypothetical protein
MDEGKLHLFAAIARASLFAYAELYTDVSKVMAAQLPEVSDTSHSAVGLLPVVRRAPRTRYGDPSAVGPRLYLGTSGRLVGPSVWHEELIYNRFHPRHGLQRQACGAPQHVRLCGAHEA